MTGWTISQGISQDPKYMILVTEPYNFAKIKKERNTALLVRKRSRVRVTIEGQHVLLQISLQINFFDFLLYSQLCGLVFNIFTMFFRDSEVCLERCDSYVGFGYLTKYQTFLFEEKFVKEHVVLLL